MQIGETSRVSGFSPDTLRYYEKLGLLPPVAHNAAGRRDYGKSDLSRLAFIRRARAARFTLAEIKTLLELRDSRRPPRRAVQALTATKVETLRTQLDELRHLHNELALLLNLCRGDGTQRCPIIAHFEESDRARNDPCPDSRPRRRNKY
ncbi:MAG: MerR family transcriptional regulator [Gammaproteobacteria bacterium]